MDVILRVVGPKRSPYALGLTCGGVFPAIYDDVMLVILAPLVRRLARESGRGVAPLGGALAVGLQGGLLIVVPGAAVLAAAGALNISLGIMLMWGLPFLATGLVIAVFLHSRLVDRVWNKAKHELEDQTYLLEQDGVIESARAATNHGDAAGTLEQSSGGGGHPRSGSVGMADAPETTSNRRQFPLVVALLPVLAPLVMITSYTVSKALGVQNGLLEFLGNPIVALLSGLLLAIVLPFLSSAGKASRRRLPAVDTSGVILLFTAVAGSLGQVINSVGVGDMLADLFAADTALPVLLAWVVAALLRLAQGSASVSLITAATLLAPIVTDLGTPAPLIVLAAAAGAMFGGHVTDNTFWMFQTLFGLTARGTFLVYTGALATFSCIGLVMVLLINLIA